MGIYTVPANVYEQFDADYNLDVPGEGYGGWKKAPLPFDTDTTAFIVMHAWDVGTLKESPGSYKSCEYVPRSIKIADGPLRELLLAARKAGAKIIHVNTAEDAKKNPERYEKAARLAGPPLPPPERVPMSDTTSQLFKYRVDNGWPGEANLASRAETAKRIDLLKTVYPLPGEYVVMDSEQLFAVCRAENVSHIIYSGFCINACLLMSPGCMVDMSRRGVMCSAIRQTVTAVENKETARAETAKELALWSVSVFFGLVYDWDDIMDLFERMG